VFGPFRLFPFNHFAESFLPASFQLSASLPLPCGPLRRYLVVDLFENPRVACNQAYTCTVTCQVTLKKCFVLSALSGIVPILTLFAGS
jgi:hypothetical protein